MPTVVVVTPTVLLARAVSQQKRWNVGVVARSVTRATLPVALTLVARRRRQARTLTGAITFDANAVAFTYPTNHGSSLVLEGPVTALGTLDFTVATFVFPMEATRWRYLKIR